MGIDRCAHLKRRYVDLNNRRFTLKLGISNRINRFTVKEFVIFYRVTYVFERKYIINFFAFHNKIRARYQNNIFRFIGNNGSIGLFGNFVCCEIEFHRSYVQTLPLGDTYRFERMCTCRKCYVFDNDLFYVPPYVRSFAVACRQCNTAYVNALSIDSNVDIVCHIRKPLVFVALPIVTCYIEDNIHITIFCQRERIRYVSADLVDTTRTAFIFTVLILTIGRHTFATMHEGF